jgi:hypothetical protein
MEFPFQQAAHNIRSDTAGHHLTDVLVATRIGPVRRAVEGAANLLVSRVREPQRAKVMKHFPA